MCGVLAFSCICGVYWSRRMRISAFCTPSSLCVPKPMNATNAFGHHNTTSGISRICLVNWTLKICGYERGS